MAEEKPLKPRQCPTFDEPVETEAKWVDRIATNQQQQNQQTAPLAKFKADATELPGIVCVWLALKSARPALLISVHAMRKYGACGPNVHFFGITACQHAGIQAPINIANMFRLARAKIRLHEAVLLQDIPNVSGKMRN